MEYIYISYDGVMSDGSVDEYGMCDVYVRKRYVLLCGMYCVLWYVRCGMCVVGYVSECV